MHFKSIVLLFALLLVACIFNPSIAQANFTDTTGYFYHPTNFVSGQTKVGRSINVTFQVFASGPDFELIQNPPPLANHEFRILANQDLYGANCVLTKSVSDSNGMIAGTCSANATGKFIFHVESIAGDYPRSDDYIIQFADHAQTADELAAETKDWPKYTVTEITKDKGPCHSSPAEGGSYDSCGTGFSNYVLTCSNGYQVRINYASCVHSMSDAFIFKIEQQVCGGLRCDKATASPAPKASPKASIKPVASPKASPVASASAEPAASLVPQVDSSSVPTTNQFVAPFSFTHLKQIFQDLFHRFFK